MIVHGLDLGGGRPVNVAKIYRFAGVASCIRHSKLPITAALLLAAVSAIYTARHFAINTDINDLLSQRREQVPIYCRALRRYWRRSKLRADREAFLNRAGLMRGQSYAQRCRPSLRWR
jgi:hypothetical protein